MRHKKSSPTARNRSAVSFIDTNREAMVLDGSNNQQFNRLVDASTYKGVHRTLDNLVEQTGRGEDALFQVLALNNEMQVRYDQGMTVPDDRPLLLANNNLDSIHRLPVFATQSRTDGYVTKFSWADLKAPHHNLEITNK